MLLAQSGLSPDPAKVQAVRDWKVPESVTETRSFLGLVGYYHSFIPQFARIAAPLTNLAKKNHPFTWSLREGEAFKQLKDALLHAPVLQLADPTREFIVTTDANNFAIGDVLSQVWDDGEHPIAYERRKMNVAEGNYAMHEENYVQLLMPYGPSGIICWAIIYCCDRPQFVAVFANTAYPFKKTSTMGRIISRI